MEDKIRILLADDQPIIRDGLRSLLTQEPDFEVIAEAPDGQAAVELTQTCQPHIVLMGVTMPRMSGVEATERIKQRLPRVAVVGLSMHNSPQVRRAMQRAGADAYVCKDEVTDVLKHTIREIWRQVAQRSLA